MRKKAISARKNIFDCLWKEKIVEGELLKKFPLKIISRVKNFGCADFSVLKIFIWQSPCGRFSPLTFLIEAFWRVFEKFRGNSEIFLRKKISKMAYFALFFLSNYAKITQRTAVDPSIWKVTGVDWISQLQKLPSTAICGIRTIFQFVEKYFPHVWIFLSKGICIKISLYHFQNFRKIWGQMIIFAEVPHVVQQ